MNPITPYGLSTTPGPTTELAFQGLILDLNNIIIDTLQIHYYAWKETLDDFFEPSWKPHLSFYQKFCPFTHEEYCRFFERIPKRTALRAFLKHRGVLVDLETFETLIRKKSGLVYKILGHKSLPFYQQEIDTILLWRRLGMNLGLVTSTLSSWEIIKQIGLQDCFEIMVDTSAAAMLGIQQRKKINFFLEAAKAMDKSPQDCAIVVGSTTNIDDADVGIFKQIIHVDHSLRPEEINRFTERGDLVVKHLSEVNILKTRVGSQ